MRPADRLRDWLAGQTDRECDRIFASALRRAEPEYFHNFAEILLTRRSDVGAAALIEHFEHVDPELRARLLSDEELLRTGVAHAMRGSRAARAGALRVLEARPTPRLAYLLPDTLREKNVELRDAGARLMRSLAANVWDRTVASYGTSNAFAATSLAADREQVVRALIDGLRTFELHHCIEVLEAALWFAEDLEAELWTLLQKTRSRCAYVVNEHLQVWNTPRMAGFLLLALLQPDWRMPAQKLLQIWRSPEELRALLTHSHLLERPALRRVLATIRKPVWFEAIGRDLGHLPQAIRGCVPRWLCALGFSDEERIERLAEWLGSADPAVHRAAVYALASLNHPAGLRWMERVAEGRTALAPFARWYVRGRQDALRGAMPTRTAPVAVTPQVAPEVREAILPEDPSLPGLWQVCRRTPDRPPAESIEALRRGAEAWRPRLAQYLRSPDARDRALLLEVLAAPDLLKSFSDELRELSDDPVDTIRTVARFLVNQAWGSTGGKDASSLTGFEALRAAQQAAQRIRALVTAHGPSPAPAAAQRERREIRTLLGMQELKEEPWPA